MHDAKISKKSTLDLGDVDRVLKADHRFKATATVVGLVNQTGRQEEDGHTTSAACSMQ